MDRKFINTAKSLVIELALCDTYQSRLDARRVATVFLTRVLPAHQTDEFWELVTALEEIERKVYGLTAISELPYS